MNNTLLEKIEETPESLLLDNPIWGDYFVGVGKKVISPFSYSPEGKAQWGSTKAI